MLGREIGDQTRIFQSAKAAAYGMRDPRTISYLAILDVELY